ncbi:MAG TPA: alpha/beta hydrolase-fold protein [Mycobacteriales bacterium]|nr:alpha/beta hydrolase-fold protein [Mycobacteriales bacterium]
MSDHRGAANGLWAAGARANGMRANGLRAAGARANGMRAAGALAALAVAAGCSGAPVAASAAAPGAGRGPSPGSTTAFALPSTGPCAPAKAAPNPPAVAARFRGHLEFLHLPTGEPATPTRTVVVYRPAVPDRASLPIVYLLHGLPGNPTSAVVDPGFREQVDTWTARGRPFVVVAPDGNAANVADTEWGDDVHGRVQLQSWVLHTVIPIVEGAHRRPARLRAIAGFSMGAFGAMDYYLRHREVWGQVVALAGYWGLEDPDKIFGTTAATQRPWEPLVLAPAHGAGGRVLLVGSCRDTDAVMLAALRRAGANVVYWNRRGGHTWLLVRNNLPEILGWLFAGWRSP